ncbi:MAG TPA: hypothetical protein VGW12_21045 [Pyrinomonadaceae bacterium]|nr:hypothetical protein [Pyrinomonadaceae bacterium]
MRKSAFQKTVRFASLFVVLLASVVSASAQTTPANSPPQAEVTATAQGANDEKAEEIVRRAVAAQGGSAYLGVKSLIGRGYYSQFDKGLALPPQKFVDYLVFPDRERTEFRGARGRYIQTNEGERGWIYEEQTRSLVDMTPEQVANFKLAMRTSTDNLLRGWWRAAGARLTYLGRREAGLAKRNEAVRLTYPDGFVVDYEIGAKDALPAKTLYKRKSAEGEEVAEEDRFASYQNIGGLTVPFVIDHYRAGQQSSRINYDSVEFNVAIPDTLFAKPANIKAIK